jgi:hypothetical protein
MASFLFGLTGSSFYDSPARVLAPKPPDKIVLADPAKISLQSGGFPAVTVYVGVGVTRTPTYGFDRLTKDFAAMLVITELVEA